MIKFIENQDSLTCGEKILSFTHRCRKSNQDTLLFLTFQL